jgi:NTE family protein
MKILCLCSGGFKCISHIGIIKFLHNNNVLSQINTFAGSSGGSIIATMCVLNYSFEEMKEFVTNINFKLLMNTTDVVNLIANWGFDKGNRFNHVFESLIEFKNFNKNIKMKELYDITKKNLVITTSCVNTNKPMYINYKSHPNMTLKMALRMSTCVPVLMQPILYENKFYLDGGCSSHLPNNIFDRNETLSINLENPQFDKNKLSDNKINDIEDYIFQIFKTFWNNYTSHINKNVINISSHIDSLDFDISGEIINNTINSAFDQMNELLKSNVISIS